jgi:hypothetical protein
MPVGQVDPTTQPSTSQYSFRQLTGLVLQFAPDIPVQVAKAFVAQSYRRVIDSRNFYGTLIKGQVNVPNSYTLGTVLVTYGSNIVTAVGTQWNSTMVGYQFRVGFSTPIYTITQVISPTQLQLDLTWGSMTQTGVSYQIFNNQVSFGSNIKRLLAVVNQRQGYRLKLNVPQEVLNIYDTWRTTTGWTFLVANYAPAADGSPLFELYPAPTFQQSFPFLAYIQPPDLVNDDDYPVSAVRGDVILYGALPQALTFRGKNSKYYDPLTAASYQKMFDMEMNKMQRMDNDLYQKDLIWEFSAYPFTQYGADWAQSHDLDSNFL